MTNRSLFRPTAGRRLRLTTAVVSLAVSLSVVTANASLFVSLVQVPPVPTEYAVGEAQSVDMLLKVNGTLDDPLSVVGFSVVMTWTPPARNNPLTGLPVAATTLQTVDVGGNPSTDASETTIVSDPGYLFSGKQPLADMLVTGLDADTQRYLAITANPTTIAAGDVDLTIALIRFAVGPLGPAWGVPYEYTFAMDGSDESLQLGFIDSEFNQVPVANGGGTILAVPEPATAAILLPGVLVLGGFGLRRGLIRRRSQKSAA